MSDHAPLAPSAAHRWARCPGSVRMTKDFSKKTGRAALRGTAMHQVLETCLKKAKHPSIFLDNVFNIEDQDVTFDEDLVRWTTEAVEWVHAYKKEHRGCHLIAEARLLTGKALAEDLVDEIWGTADVLAYSKSELLVFDLKGGYVDVDVVDNYQLILYAIGAVAHFEDAMDIPPIESIRLVIFQPQRGGAKELTVPREMLDEWRGFLERAAREAVGANAPLRASEAACKWCPALGRCPAAAERANELARHTSWPEVAEAITEEQLCTLLSRAGFIRKFLDAAEAHALSYVANGNKLPGFKMVAKKKHRKWVDEKKIRGKLQELFGTEGLTTKPITPAQAEKLCKKANVDPAELEDDWETPPGDPELVPIDDPRPTLPFRELKVIDGGSD